jgi:hypothetical protein
MNLCRACGRDFASTRAFDAHRIGRHAYTYAEGLQVRPPRADGRRCLTLDEMQGFGWERDRWGRWVHPQALRSRPRKGSYSSPDSREPVVATGRWRNSQRRNRHEIEAATA